MKIGAYIENNQIYNMWKINTCWNLPFYHIEPYILNDMHVNFITKVGKYNEYLPSI